MVHFDVIALLAPNYYSSLHAFIKLIYNFHKVVRASEHLHDFPKHCSIYCVEGFLEVYKHNVQLLVLLDYFFLNLSKAEYHVNG